METYKIWLTDKWYEVIKISPSYRMVVANGFATEGAAQWWLARHLNLTSVDDLAKWMDRTS
jgi:hypothetical protein